MAYQSQFEQYIMSTPLFKRLNPEVQAAPIQQAPSAYQPSPQADPMGLISPQYTRAGADNSMAPLQMYQQYQQTGQMPQSSQSFQTWQPPKQNSNRPLGLGGFNPGSTPQGGK